MPAATPTPQPAEPSPQPAALDDAIAEILATVRAVASGIDALQDEPRTAKELARETASLTQEVADARGVLAKAAELAARRDGAAETARALSGADVALKTQGEALDQASASAPQNGSRRWPPTAWRT